MTATSAQLDSEDAPRGRSTPPKQAARPEAAPSMLWNSARFQFSVKLALAGLLSLFCSLLLNLPSPGWSVTTAALLMMANYLGAVAEKSILRAVGTVIGGLVGVALVGNLTDNVVLFLLLSGGFVAVCTYYFGGAKYPYAFFLAALTMVLVISETLRTPAEAWFIAIYRIQEIFAGIICSLVVSAVLWPRYARMDFLDLAEDNLRRMRVFLDETFPAIIEGREISTTKAVNDSLKALRRMQLLISMGSRESVYFRARLPAYKAIVGAQSIVLHTLLDLCEQAPGHPIRQTFIPRYHRLHEAIGKFFDSVLGTRNPEDSHAAACAALQKEWEDFLAASEDWFDDMVEHAADREDSSYALLAAGRFASITDLVASLQRVAEILGEPGNAENFRFVAKEPHPGPSEVRMPWVFNGLRGGIAFCIALVICDWVHPPGGPLAPIWAFLFAVIARNYIGGSGDVGAFTHVVRAGIYGIPWMLGVYFLAPLMTHYFFLNLFFGGLMFVFAWVAFPFLPGFSAGSFLLLNASVITFSVDFQRHVTFFDLSSVYIGGMLGIVIAALVQRLLWPVLPQREFLRAAGEILRHTNKMLSPESEKEALRASVIASLQEAEKWSSAMKPPSFTAEDLRQRSDSLGCFRMLTKSVWTTVSAKPDSLQGELAGLAETVRLRVSAMLDELKTALAGKGPLPQTQELDEAEERLLEATKAHIAEVSANQEEPGEVRNTLIAVQRHRKLARHTRKVLTSVSPLDLELYRKDFLL